MAHYLTCPSRGALLHPTGFFHIIIIVFPILSTVFGFCSLCTNDNEFCLMDPYTLFFFNHQLSFWKQFFSWWPTIVYCIIVLCFFLWFVVVLYYSENKLYMKLKLNWTGIIPIEGYKARYRWGTIWNTFLVQNNRIIGVSRVCVGERGTTLSLCNRARV